MLLKHCLNLEYHMNPNLKWIFPFFYHIDFKCIKFSNFFKLYDIQKFNLWLLLIQTWFKSTRRNSSEIKFIITIIWD